MCSYTTFEVKVDLCAHTDRKNGTFTRRVYTGYILTRTPPPPFPQVHRGGCYLEKFFSFFIFSDFRFGFSTIVFYSTRFLKFSFRLAYKLSLDILHVWISRFQTINFYSFLLVMFYSHQFRLVSALSILCFNSSTLYLFDSSAC